MLNNSLNFIRLFSLCLIMITAVRIPAIAQESDSKHSAKSWRTPPTSTVVNASDSKPKKPIPSSPSNPVTPISTFQSVCTENPAPKPPPSPYVYSNGNQDGNDMAVKGGFEIESDSKDPPRAACRYDGPNYISTADTKDTSLVCRFDFAHGNHSWMGATLLSSKSCWGDWPCDPSYNLSQYKTLLFKAKGEKGGEKIIVKAADNQKHSCGDSAQLPVVSNSIELTTDWKQFHIDLLDDDFHRVITPFTIIVFPGTLVPKSKVTVYIDDVYYQ